MQSIPLFNSYSLRPLRFTDSAEIFHAIDTQRAYLGRWLPFVEKTVQVEQTQQVVTTMLTDSINPIFTLRDGETFAGLIGFKSANTEKQSIEIGYWLREEYQGRGFMTAAVKALCTYAFGTLGIRRIEIRCAVDNAPSNRIPQRLGFRFERIEPRGEELAGGIFTDLNLYINEK